MLGILFWGVGVIGILAGIEKLKTYINKRT